jgi:hypothetical protein
MTRQSVRLSPGTLYGGRCEAGEEHGVGHGFPLRGGGSGLPGRQQRLQLYPLGEDNGGSVALRGAGVPG